MTLETAVQLEQKLMLGLIKNIQFFWFVLSKRQIAWTKNFHRSFILWHWRTTKTLGKNWIVVSKSAWKNWWISFQQARGWKFKILLVCFVLKVNFFKQKLSRNQKGKLARTKNFHRSFILWHWKPMQKIIILFHWQLYVCYY